MVRPLSILIGVHPDQAYDRQAFNGIVACARTHGNVLLHLKGRDQPLGEAFAQHAADGAILSTGSPERIAEAAAIGKPCVNVANHLAGHPLVPVVGNDDEAIGATVARHYLERGFRHFAFFTDVNFAYFWPRAKGFAETIRAAGFACAVGPPPFDSLPAEERTTWDAHVGRWVASLPKPLGLMCAFDPYALEVFVGCRLAGLSVPDDVSVIGVDDDDLICLTTTPQLSSVAPLAARIGREAMDLLLNLIAGAPKPERPILLPPGQIIVCGSSGEMAAGDAAVVAALKFIRARVATPLSVGAVVEHVAISRRALERRFLATLGRTPLAEIRRARVERAKQLLTETDLPLAEIARRSGLLYQQRLSTLMQAETGLTPTAFRRTFRHTH